MTLKIPSNYSAMNFAAGHALSLSIMNCSALHGTCVCVCVCIHGCTQALKHVCIGKAHLCIAAFVMELNNMSGRRHILHHPPAPALGHSAVHKGATHILFK